MVGISTTVGVCQLFSLLNSQCLVQKFPQQPVCPDVVLGNERKKICTQYLELLCTRSTNDFLYISGKFGLQVVSIGIFILFIF
jgi:hypothetical protein